METIDLGTLKYTAGIDVRPFKTALDGMSTAVARFEKSAVRSLNVGPIIGSFDRFTASTSRASSGLVGLAIKAGAVGVGLGAIHLAGRAASAGFDFLSHGIKTASDLNEQLNATNLILGEGAPAVIRMANEMADKFGSSKKAILETATSFAALGKGAGLSGGALNDFSTKMTRLADDFGSVANLETAEVGKAFTIALSGESSDTLKKYGIDTRQAAVEAFAYSRGLARVGDELSQNQKLLAVAGILTEKLRFAEGDHARTANETTNAYRRMTGQYENLSATIGATLLPVASNALGAINDIVSGANGGFDPNSNALTGITRTLNEWVDTAKILATEWSAAWEVVGLKAGAVGHNTFERLKNPGLAIGEATGVGDWIEGNLRKVLPNAISDIAFGKAGPKGVAPVRNKLDLIDADAITAPIIQGMSDRAAKRNGMGPSVRPTGPAVKPPALPPIMDASTIKGLKEARTELEHFAKSLRDRVRLPLEEKADILRRGLEAFNLGLIGKTELSRLESFADKEAGINPVGKRLAEASIVGSQEAYAKAASATLDLPKDYGMKAAEEAQRANAKSQTQIVDLLRQILEATKKPQPQPRKAPDAAPAMN